MSHGAGGKATQSLIEGLLAPAFGIEQLADAEAVPGTDLVAHDRQLRGQADPLSRRLDRRAGRERDRERPRGGRRPTARADAFDGLEEGLGAEELRAEVEAIAEAARAADVQIITGDTKVVERGHADAMYLCTTGVGRVDPRASLAPDALRPGDRVLVVGHDRRARHGDHAGTRRARPGGRHLVRHAPALAGGGRAARGGRPGASLHARRDPGRRRIGAERARARLGVAVLVQRGRRSGAARRSRGPPSCSGSTRCTWRTRASSWRWSRPRRRIEALAAMRSVPGCEEAAEIGEVRTEPEGMVLVETAFGGKRVMDLLAGDPLPRIC